MSPTPLSICRVGVARRSTDRAGSRAALGGGLLLGLLLASGGCSSKPKFQFDELDLVPAQEELMEFSLGKYTVPVPFAGKMAGERLSRRNGLQIDFELFALVNRNQKSRIADAWGRHEGKVRDRVIRVCRQASLEELTEPELATLKAHLMDAIHAQLGDKEVRQLLITQVDSEEL